MNANRYDQAIQSEFASRTGTPRWVVWFTVYLLGLMATISIVFLAVVIASYNGEEALAGLLIRIIVALLIIGFSLNVAMFSAILWHGSSNRLEFPEFSRDEILFDEKNAGGYSLLSWHTRRFPSQNNLHISIARDMLWIRPRFFSSVAIGLQLDQVHQIPLASVEEVIVDLRGSGIVLFRGEFDVTYRSSTGRSRSFRLWLRKHEEFLAIVRSNCHQARFDTRAPEGPLTKLITNWFSRK